MSKIIVVGGGAAGMMAAAKAAEDGNEVVLYEKNEKLGKKVYITGKGRCNVTNACDTTEFFQSVLSNEKFLYSSIYGFDRQAVMDFFERNGCPLKIERGERVFPVSDHAVDIIKCFERVLERYHVVVKKNTEVTQLLIDENGVVTGVEIKHKERIIADAVIMACGGKSYPSTGSDGKTFALLEKAGHHVNELRPGLVPLEIAEEQCKQMQGLSLKNVTLTLYCGKKEIYQGFGEMLFTHFGISGPLGLSAASYANAKCYKKEWLVRIDLKPALSEEQLDKRLLRDFEADKNKQFKNALSGLLPGKMIQVMPSICKIPEDKAVHDITREERKQLVKALKQMEFHATGTRDFNEAIITIGGINVKEINPSTMESKLVKNLYFAGEMIDVDALTGGFNLQIAWSSGYLAGESAGSEGRI